MSYIKIFSRLVIVGLHLLANTNRSSAQEKRLVNPCGTMQVLEHAFKENPLLKPNFNKQSAEFQQSVIKRIKELPASDILQDSIYIPVVFHIVLVDPTIISDEQVHAQLNVLNNDFAGMNSDSVNLPAGFKPLFGKSHIRFKLAKRTPDNEPTTGIVRTTTTTMVYGTFDKSLKYSTLGGDDAWDHNRYLNVWITNLAGGLILGYSTLPGTSEPAEDGVVIHYTTLPADSLTTVNRGRTLTHEAGHYFYLHHIWGDENGCTGTDFVDDTPNQTSFTSGCPGGAIVTDACSAVAPGILYQNYMDYSDDACMCLFTHEQVIRMETAIADFRAGYYTSDGADPIPLFSLDAALRKIIAPSQRVCTESFSPVITLRNRGIQTLSSAVFYVSMDNGPAKITNWTGSLSSLEETNVTLPAFSITNDGNHFLKVVVSLPNGNPDLNTSNDTITSTFQYYKTASSSLAEGFENNIFPPAGWDIINPDNRYTWERVTGIAGAGSASVVLRNFDYRIYGQKDYFRLPMVNIRQADSAFLTFRLAAAVKTTSTPGFFWDTLQVLISTDCGVTYNTIYKKWGPSLITRNISSPLSFVPSSSEWRKDSIDLTAYINAGPILLAFLNTTQNNNNIYLDDINIYNKVINPNLHANDFLIAPNPATDAFTVHFYTYPSTLRAIVIYNSSGQKIQEQEAKGSGTVDYNFDMRRFASGIYFVQAIFDDKKLTQKVVKR